MRNIIICLLVVTTFSNFLFAKGKNRASKIEQIQEKKIETRWKEAFKNGPKFSDKSTYNDALDSFIAISKISYDIEKIINEANRISKNPNTSIEKAEEVTISMNEELEGLYAEMKPIIGGLNDLKTTNDNAKAVVYHFNNIRKQHRRVFTK